MKKIMILLSAFILITGCSMKTEYNMNIKEDKSMDLGAIIAMDDELIDYMMESEGYSEDYTEDEMWNMLETSLEEDSNDSFNYEDSGFVVNRYEYEKWTGFQFIKKIENIDEISGDTAITSLEKIYENSDSTLFIKDGDNYKLNLVFESENQNEEIGNFNIPFEILLTITLPNKPISHNATSVSEDGKTLTWDLTKIENINLEFSLEKSTNYLPFIIVGVGLIVILIVLFVIIKSKKNNKPKTTDLNQNIPVNNTVSENNNITIQPQNSVNSQINTISQGSNIPRQINQQNSVEQNINSSTSTGQPQNMNIQSNIVNQVASANQTKPVQTENSNTINPIQSSVATSSVADNNTIQSQKLNTVPDIFSQPITTATPTGNTQATLNQNLNNIQSGMTQNDNMVNQNIQSNPTNTNQPNTPQNNQ